MHTRSQGCEWDRRPPGSGWRSELAELLLGLDCVVNAEHIESSSVLASLLNGIEGGIRNGHRNRAPGWTGESSPRAHEPMESGDGIAKEKGMRSWRSGPAPGMRMGLESRSEMEGEWNRGRKGNGNGERRPTGTRRIVTMSPSLTRKHGEQWTAMRLLRFSKRLNFRI